jgi:hypothetical protein
MGYGHMAIHGFRDMVINAACLVGLIGRGIFLFDYMDESGWYKFT